jgi:hypothetical protein
MAELHLEWLRENEVTLPGLPVFLSYRFIWIGTGKQRPRQLIEQFRGVGSYSSVVRPLLIQKVSAIQRIALFGDEARVADHPAQLFLACLMVRAGGGDHVLFDHDAAHVVTAKT